MGNSEKHGAIGEMVLERDWQESSSGHTENFDDYKLVACSNEMEITLVRAYGTKDFITPGAGDYRVTKTGINVKTLIALIEQHGQEC